MQGFILLARSLQDSDIWIRKPDSWLKIWLHVLFEVNYADNTPHDGFQRGASRFCYDVFRGVVPHLTPRIYERCISWLRAQGMISTERTPRGLVITVNLYDQYQDAETYRRDAEPARAIPGTRRPPKAKANGQGANPGRPPKKDPNPEPLHPIQFARFADCQELDSLTPGQWNAIVESLAPGWPIDKAVAFCIEGARLEGRIGKVGSFVKARFDRYTRDQADEIRERKSKHQAKKALLADLAQFLAESAAEGTPAAADRAERARNDYRNQYGQQFVDLAEQRARLELAAKGAS